MTENTLKITFGQADEHRKAARERLQRAEEGATGASIEQDARFILDFEEYADVEQLMRQSNLELVRVIANDEPDSIRATATAVDRDYREVHRNLQELAELGVIEFVTEGTSKRPILRAGTERIDFSFQFGRIDDSSPTEAADG